MGERKGQNKYYPPDFDHKKHFSLNSYHGVHALRERGAKAHEGILIIRFEMPFNCWCLTCNKPIGMGVRYNSEKTKVGQFYSTPVYQFKMPCHMCAGDIVIETDPEHFQYVIVKGARRREQRYDPVEIGLPELADSRTKEKLASDPMFHLEHAVKDEREEAKVARPSIRRLVKGREELFDDFRQNQLARKRFREEKKVVQAKQLKLNNLAKKLSLSGSEITLLPMAECDREAALAHLKNENIDASEKAVEKRKAALVKTFKSKATRVPVSRYLAFTKGFSKKRPQSSVELRDKPIVLGDTSVASLVCDEYCSSGDDNNN